MKHEMTRLSGKVAPYKVIIRNFSYLSALQAFNMLLPFITYPYLIRVLGTGQYGLVIFAQIIAGYFGILIDYGFRITATREVSVHRDHAQKLSEIVSSVLTIKLILWLISFAVLLVLVYTVPALQREKLLYIFSFGLCFNELMFPQWYFQGMERMKYITLINLATRTAFLLLIFVFVRGKSDYLLVPLLNGAGAFTGGAAGLIVLFAKDRIRFTRQTLPTLKYYFTESSPLFGSNAIISVKDRFNVIFIGSSLGMKEVVIYDLAVKVMNIFIQPVDLINTAIYPKMAKDRNMKFLLKATALAFAGMAALVAAMQLFMSPLIAFLGKGLSEAVLPARVLLAAPLIMVWSVALGRNCILVHGKYKPFVWGMLFTTLFYLALVALAAITGHIHSVMAFIVITLMVYLFELLFRIFIVKKYHLL